MNAATIPPQTQTSSVYVHFPFCETKCHYCDFYSLGRERTRAEDPDRFAQALRREVELRIPSVDLAPTLETLFFGGGTPSLTPARDMAFALERLLRHVGPQTEWTMEANPSSLSLESLKEYRALGVNRISMGVQAMQPEHLTRLGRVHSRDQVFRALDAVFGAGFENVSTDLLCGVPGQTLEELESSMDALLQYPITHLSCYLLTLPPHHAMYAELPPEDDQLKHLLFIDQKMGSAGFEHYEISNFARRASQKASQKTDQNFRARHNLAYWSGRSYWGLGPSAHGYDATAGVRTRNSASLHRYANELAAGRLPVDEREVLTPEQQSLEKWMLALRLADGFPKDWVSTPLQRARIEQLKEKSLLETHPELPQRYRLTPRGFPLSDSIVAQLSL